jgi:nitrile hydratase
MDPRHYLGAGYYERSLTALASLLVDKGLCTRDELERRAGGAVPLGGRAAPGRTNHADRRHHRIGDRVRVRGDVVPGHGRLPGYVRGHVGVVVGVSPPYPVPDAHAHGVAADDEPTYDVRFEARDLWPGSADDAQVHVGLFESYLQRDGD